MNTTNLRLISSIDVCFLDNEYLDSQLDKQKVGLIERICRAVLSVFTKYVDTTQTACLRTSLLSLKGRIENNTFKVPPKIKKIFDQYTPIDLKSLPYFTIEEMADQLTTTIQGIQRKGKGCQFLQSAINSNVFKALEDLFENSKIPLNKIPHYQEIDKRPMREKMTAPIMAGWGNTVKDPRPFLAIKVEKVAEPSEKDLIWFGQYYPSGPYYGDIRRNEYAWYDMSSGPHFFHSGNFTAIDTGEGPTDSQKENFANFQKFLEFSEGTDLNGAKWRIDCS